MMRYVTPRLGIGNTNECEMTYVNERRESKAVCLTTLMRDVYNRLGLYAVTVSMAQRHLYDGHHTYT